MAPDIGLELRLCASAVAERFIETPKAAAGARWREVVGGLVRGLEEEQGKIEAFKRELPFCVRIIADAVEVLKMKLEQYEIQRYKLTEELFPVKNTCEENRAKKRDREKENDNMDKKNWMSSVQLWNDNNMKKFEKENKKICVEPKSAFTPFKCPSPITITRSNEETIVPLSDLSLQSPMPGEQMSIHAQHQHSPRKARRCWSEHLHRLFLYAMEQLGGPHEATPRKIRELMKVEGLTNDEVKSHLQKFRLRDKKVPNSSGQGNQQVVGRFSVPRDHFLASWQKSALRSGSPQGPLDHVGSTPAGSLTAEDSFDGYGEPERC